MIFNYSSFLKESVKYKRSIFWKEDLDELLKFDWLSISITSQAFRSYSINIEGDKYQYEVYFDVDNMKNEILLLDDGEESHDVISKKFWEKFELEFLKNPSTYLKNMKYIPKCLGDVSHHLEGEKFGL